MSIFLIAEQNVEIIIWKSLAGLKEEILITSSCGLFWVLLVFTGGFGDWFGFVLVIRVPYSTITCEC